MARCTKLWPSASPNSSASADSRLVSADTPPLAKCTYRPFRQRRCDHLRQRWVVCPSSGRSQGAYDGRCAWLCHAIGKQLLQLLMKDVGKRVKARPRRVKLVVPRTRLRRQRALAVDEGHVRLGGQGRQQRSTVRSPLPGSIPPPLGTRLKIGRASCRERV